MPEPADLSASTDDSTFIRMCLISDEDGNIRNLRRVLDDAQRDVFDSLSALRRATDALDKALKEDRARGQQRHSVAQPNPALASVRPPSLDPFIEEVGVKVQAVARLSRAIGACGKVDTAGQGRSFNVDAFIANLGGFKRAIDVIPGGARHARPWFRQDWRSRSDAGRLASQHIRTSGVAPVGPLRSGAPIKPNPFRR